MLAWPLATRGWRAEDRLYGLPDATQTGYLCAACEGPGPFRLPDDDLRSCSAMDSDQVNKVLMAVLFTCLGVLSLNIAAGAIFTPPQPAKPGYLIPVQEHPAAGDHGAAPAAPQPIEVLLASSSPERGESAAKPCIACHGFEKGGPNKVGPTLWNVV